MQLRAFGDSILGNTSLEAWSEKSELHWEKLLNKGFPSMVFLISSIFLINTDLIDIIYLKAEICVDFELIPYVRDEYIRNFIPYEIIQLAVNLCILHTLEGQ